MVRAPKKNWNLPPIAPPNPGIAWKCTPAKTPESQHCNPADEMSGANLERWPFTSLRMNASPVWKIDKWDQPTRLSPPIPVTHEPMFHAFPARIIFPHEGFAGPKFLGWTARRPMRLILRCGSRHWSTTKAEGIGEDLGRLDVSRDIWVRTGK